MRNSTQLLAEAHAVLLRGSLTECLDRSHLLCLGCVCLRSILSAHLSVCSPVCLSGVWSDMIIRRLASCAHLLDLVDFCSIVKALFGVVRLRALKVKHISTWKWTNLCYVITAASNC